MSEDTCVRCDGTGKNSGGRRCGRCGGDGREVPPVEGSQPNAWARRMWRSLSVANVWASGVATREHAWGMVVAAVFFAVTSWYLSDVRLSVALGGSQAKGSE